MKEVYLYKKLEGNKAQCQTCAHYCVVLPDKRGICGVRENRSGILYALNYGKIVAKNIDPIEKKPFYHFLPGTSAYSIASVGCNFACQNCFIPHTAITTDHGLMSIENIFDLGKNSQYKNDGSEVREISNLSANSHRGHYKKIIKAFRHPFKNEILVLKPRYSPPIECTKGHKFFATKNPDAEKLEKIRADQLSRNHYLAIPKVYPFPLSKIKLNAKEILASRAPTFLRKNTKTDWKIANEILKLSLRGETSKNLALKYHFHPTYIRKLRSRLKKEGISKALFWYENRLMEKNGKVKFLSEKGPGIPQFIRLDEKFSKLLGYYCAEGCISQAKNRPNSYQLMFCFGRKEKEYIKEVKDLIEEIFQIKPKVVQKRTATTVNVGSASLALLFKILCGAGAKNKKVPEILSQATKGVARAFLNGFIAGDGSIQKEEISIGTISREMAFGVYWLWSKMGFLPSFYKWNPPSMTVIEGRRVRQSPYYYVKLKSQKFRKSFLNNDLTISPKSQKSPLFKENNLYYFIPVFKISKKYYSGYVYNIEVEEDHSYLANFVSVGNCQNWDISQEPKIHAHSQIIGQGLTPEDVVADTKMSNCPSIAYTYTEPTMALEFVLDTMKLAKKQKIKNIFVSNGFMSEESVKAVIPYLDANNIDIKGFSEEFYQKACLGRLKPVLDTAKSMKKSGVWLEITTLVIPGLSDSAETLRGIAKFIFNELGPETPWHVTQFCGAVSWRLQHLWDTPLETLKRAWAIGKKAGLKYVYTGNMPGLPSENTICPKKKCETLCIKRYGYSIRRNDKNGRCPKCRTNLNLILK